MDPHLKAAEVVVVSDAAAEDETQSLLMRIALPDHVALKVPGSRRRPPTCRPAGQAHPVLVLVPGRGLCSGSSTRG